MPSELSSNDVTEEYLIRLTAISEMQMKISQALQQLVILMQMPSESVLEVLRTVLAPIVQDMNLVNQVMQDHLHDHPVALPKE